MNDLLKITQLTKALKTAAKYRLSTHCPVRKKAILNYQHNLIKKLMGLEDVDDYNEYDEYKNVKMMLDRLQIPYIETDDGAYGWIQVGSTIFEFSEMGNCVGVENAPDVSSQTNNK